MTRWTTWRLVLRTLWRGGAALKRELSYRGLGVSEAERAKAGLAAMRRGERDG